MNTAWLIISRRDVRIAVLAITTVVVGAAAYFANREAVADKPSAVQSQRPKYGSQSVRLFHAREYLRNHDAPDFWALMPYYVHQFTERACSVASTTMVVNAARAQVDLSSADELVTQRMLLKRVSHPRWTKAIEAGGEGVTIEDIGGYLKEALERFTPDVYDIEAVRVNPNDPNLRDLVREMLIENEQSDDDFVIVVFWQATFTDDPEGETGHVAPLAAYDAERDRALVFDPDRDWYEPYWVPLDTLVAGMAKRDPETGRTRGYIWARKVRSQNPLTAAATQPDNTR